MKKFVPDRIQAERQAPSLAVRTVGRGEPTDLVTGEQSDRNWSSARASDTESARGPSQLGPSQGVASWRHNSPWTRFLSTSHQRPVSSEKVSNMGDRMTWPEICHAEEYQGRWVALDHCRYDQATMQPIEGDVVDSDDDLGSLCARMREAGMSSCAIRFCDSDDAADPVAARASAAEFRAAAR